MTPKGFYVLLGQLINIKNKRADFTPLFSKSGGPDENRTHI